MGLESYYKIVIRMKGSGAASEKHRKSRKSVPHLFLCFFKAFRNKVNLLESCNEAFLLAGDLWIKRLDFGTARERVLSNIMCYQVPEEYRHQKNPQGRRHKLKSE